jgi:putative secretion ATPase (PEP-CTERM system associated)
MPALLPGESSIMYERFYGLRERPFSLTPDPDYLYASRVHSEALGYLQYGIEGHAGFVVITGEIGSGKTTLLQTVLRNLDRQTSVSRLVNTMLDARELIEAVMLDFGLSPAPSSSKPMLLRELALFLVDQRMAGRLALLVIDEAQNLSGAALEEVRMLSNLETEKSKLIQIVLIGQPNLRDVLARPELEQLRQRITVSYHLSALENDDTHAYINHRLRRAAIGAPMQFGREVTDIIHVASRGLPRKINIIADALLLFGYGEDRHTIDVDLAREVLDELQSTGVLTPPAVEAALPVAVGAPADVPLLSRHSPVATAIDVERIAERERELAMRSAELDAREKQLAEKRRLLVEGFELLRERREATAPQFGAEPAAPWPPRPQPLEAPAVATAAAPPRPRPVRTAHPVMPRIATSLPPESAWSRLRRSLFGLPKPVLEE